MPIPRASRGQPITADLINSIIDELNKNSLISISGGKLNKSINGTTISVPQPQPIQQPTLPPFYYNSSRVGSATYFRLNAGTVNNYLPDNIHEDFLLSSSPIDPATKKYIVLDCTTDGSQIVSAEISVSATPPSPPNISLESAPESLSILLYVVVGQTPYRVLGSSSITIRVAEAARYALISVSPTGFPYEVYYTWAIFS